MPSIADVYVTVLPETSKVAAGMRKAFRDFNNHAREASKRWHRGWRSSLASRLAR